MPIIHKRTEIRLSEADLREAVSDWLNSRAPFDLSVEPADIVFWLEEDQPPDEIVGVVQTECT